MKNFIVAHDAVTANALERAGFMRVPSNDSGYVFLNNKAIKFSFDKKKVSFTNRLAM